MTADASVLRPMTDPELSRWYDRELAEAFAPQERKPLADILRLRGEGRYEPLGCKDPLASGRDAAAALPDAMTR